MPIDFVKLSTALRAILAVSNRLNALVEVIRQGKFSFEGIDVPFNAAQRALFIAQYQVLKEKLVTLVNALP